MTIRTQQMLPQTLAAYDAIRAALAGHGYTVSLADFGGFRTQADTTLILEYRQEDYNAAVAAGKISPDTTLQQFRAIAPYGSSYHDYGAAFDLSGPSAALKLAGQLAPSYGLRWPLPTRDPAHFELDMTLEDARALFNAGGADATSAGGGGDVTTTDATDATDPNANGFTTGAILAGLAVVGAILIVIRRKFLR
jgi:uncharacterized protein YaaQ